MVGIAQLVEHLVVVQGAAGSSPVTHPKFHRAKDLPCGRSFALIVGSWSTLGAEGPRLTLVGSLDD